MQKGLLLHEVSSSTLTITIIPQIPLQFILQKYIVQKGSGIWLLYEKGRYMGQLVGYARVSTTEQDLELQIEALKKYGCTEFFVDKQSGTTMERKNWQECKRYLRPRDTLVVVFARAV